MIDLNEFIYQYKNLNAFSKKVVEGFLTGLHKSPFHGFSVEFAEHRQYNLGEDIKHLDWKLFSRTDKLFIKKYEDETNLRCHIIIDKSSSMFYPKEQFSKYQFSVIAAACLLQLLKKQRDAFGINLYSDKLDIVTPIKSSPSHFSDCINLLQQELYTTPTIDINTNSGKVFSLLAEKINRRGLVIIFTDLTENIENQNDFLEGLQLLHFRKHDIMLVNVNHQALEIDFMFENVPTQFVDAETGEKIKLNPEEVRNQYKEQVQSFQKELQEKCMQYKIETFNADITKDLGKTIATFLRMRSG